MAKVIGPDFVVLPVRDLPAARHFYTDLLSLEVDPRFTTPTFVTFATKPRSPSASEKRLQVSTSASASSKRGWICG